MGICHLGDVVGDGDDEVEFSVSCQHVQDVQWYGSEGGYYLHVTRKYCSLLGHVHALHEEPQGPGVRFRVVGEGGDKVVDMV